MDDTTLGGYQQVHGRPPAFGAADGQAYSVAAFASDAGDADARGRYGAALLFVRWGEGERPVGHLETDYLAFGSVPEQALAPLLAMTLERIKAYLDECITRARP